MTIITLLKEKSESHFCRRPSLFCTRLLVGLFMLAGFISNNASAQVSAYTFSESLTGYSPLAGPTTVAFAAPWDDLSTATATAPLPFTFTFDGNAYNSCRISANGFITFGAPNPLNNNYTPLSSGPTYSGAISAFGVNLLSNGVDPIVYGEEGVAPNRVFVVQWTNAQRSADGAGTFSFQIRLHETTNIIDFSYGNCTTPSATLRSIQVGLRGQNNIFAQGNVNNRTMATTVNAEWFGNNTPGTVNNSGMRSHSPAYPDLGLQFRWTPGPPCITPTGAPSNLVIGGTSIGPTSFVGNSFTAAMPAPTNYLVLRSPFNIPPSAADVPNRLFGVVNLTMGAYTVISISGNTTFNQTGLTPETEYFYWVIPYNSNCLGAPYYNLANMITTSATTCSPATVAVAASSVGGNDFVANWTLVPTATDYRIDVSTNSGFTAILPAYNDLSVGNTDTFAVTGLSSLTQYWYRVRAIGTSCPINSNVINVTTTCGYYNIPYTQNFDTGVPLGGVPVCYSRTDANADMIQWGSQGILGMFSSAPRSMYIAKNTTQAMDDWFFLPGLNLTGGTSYRLFFRYNTNVSTSQAESLKAFLGSGQTPGQMNQTLLDLTNINNTTFNSIFVDFTPVISGVYYIGFQGSSAADQSQMAVDDISVTLAPTCLDPTNIVIGPIGTNSATISWTPPLSEPALGYQYYFSTSPTPPNAGTTPSGSVGFGVNTAVLGPLTASTTYYVWVRGNCSATDKSVWTIEESFSTECNTPLVTATTAASRCGPGSMTLNATPNAGSSINWYDQATGGSILGTGNVFNTPPIGSTTTYYAEAKALGAQAKAGPASPVAEGGTFGVQNYQASVNFTVLSNTTLQSIDIFPLASGQNGTIALRTSTNLILQNINFITSAAGGTTAQVIPINYTLPPGDYNLYLSAFPPTGLRMNTTNAFYPYSCSVAEITGNIVSNTQFLAFYNWKFTTECVSARVPVTATISSPPALTISETESTICQGESTPTITVAGHASYDTLTWLPNTNISGSFATGFTFNPSSTTTYTLTGVQTSGSFCSNLATYTVNVNAIPPPVTVIPAAAITMCEGSIQALNGSIGSMSTVPILTEDFEGATTTWSIANTSTDGDTMASQWAQRTSTYAYTSSTWNVSLRSNDNSKFYFANADAQGSSLLPFAMTRTTLQSPPINLSGYTSANLSFWHYARYILGDIFTVEVSTNNGTSWTVVQQFFGSQGTPLNFANATVDMSAFVGNANVLLRFNFISNWGYGWAVDNVVLSGSIATALSWTPGTDLYTDAAATLPYTVGTPMAIVYAKPTASIVYTATAEGSNGCTSSGTISITVDPALVGGTLNGDQSLCSGGTPSDLILSGSTGTVIRWEYADDPLFTVGVTNIANTTTTLTAAQMGVFPSIRYFRAVVGGGTCTPVYSDVASVSFPTTIWTTGWSNGVPGPGIRAIFNGNFTASVNLAACSVQVLSGTVTVNPGISMIVENEVTVTGGSLIFENNASLVQVNNSVNSGNIIYRRNTTPIRKFDYTYWSSPVAGQTLSGLSPNTNPTTFYVWNTAINNWSNTPAGTVMVPGRGYIVRAPDIAPFNVSTGNIFNATLTGVPNNGDINAPIAVVGASDLNLLGNPYPSAISADLLFTEPANTSVLDATIYLWTHNTPITNNVYTSNDYAVWNFMGGVGTAPAVNPGVNNSIPTGNIAAGQSFFIHGLANGTAVLKNSMRLISLNDQFFRMNAQPVAEGPEKHRVWLEVKNDQGAFKQMLVGYAEGATMAIDRGYDGLYVDGGNFVGLYSINSQNLTIQGRPLPFDQNDQVQLGFKTTVAGNFEIALSQFDGLFTTQNIYLEDRFLNVIHDLKESNYSFASAVGTFDGRFFLRYTNGNLGVPEVNENAVVIYNSDGTWHVNSGNLSIESIKVFDIRGRLLMVKDHIRASETSFELETADQMLLVQVFTDSGMITKKILN